MIYYKNCTDGINIEELYDGEPLYLKNYNGVFTKNLLVSAFQQHTTSFQQAFIDKPNLLMDKIVYHFYHDRNLSINTNEYSFKDIIESTTKSNNIQAFFKRLTKVTRNDTIQNVILNKNTFIIISYKSETNNNLLPFIRIDTTDDLSEDRMNDNITKLEHNDEYLLPYFKSGGNNTNSFDISLLKYSWYNIPKGNVITHTVTPERPETINEIPYGEEDDEDGDNYAEQVEDTSEDNITSYNTFDYKHNPVLKLYKDLEYYIYTTDDEYEIKFLTKYVCNPNIVNKSYSMLECLWVAEKADREKISLYSHHKINTTSKVRDIYAPNNDVKIALKHLLKPLTCAYNKKAKSGNQFAFTKNVGIKENTLLHKNNKYIVKCDISGFYDSCNWELAWRYLKFLFPRNLDADSISYYKKILKDLIINPHTNGLYMGSPVSGILSNAIIRPASIYLKNIFALEELTFSIYADDITVSSNKPISVKHVTGIVRYVFDKYELPFRLKPEKTRLGKNNGRRITGIRINHLDHLTIDRKKYYKLKIYLYRLSKGMDIDITIQALQGYLSFAKYIDESGKIDRLIEKYKDIISNSNIILENIENKENKLADEFFGITEMTEGF